MRARLFITLCAISALVAGTLPGQHAGATSINLDATASPAPVSSSSSTTPGQRSTFNIIIAGAAAVITAILASHAANRAHNLDSAKTEAAALSKERGQVLDLASFWANDSLKAHEAQKKAALAYYDRIATNWNTFLYLTTLPKDQASKTPTPSPSPSATRRSPTLFLFVNIDAATTQPVQGYATPPPPLSIAPTLFDQIVNASATVNRDFDSITVAELVQQGKNFEAQFPKPLPLGVSRAPSLLSDCSVSPPFNYNSISSFVTCGTAIVNFGDAQLKALSTRQACALLRRVWLPSTTTLQAYGDVTKNLKPNVEAGSSDLAWSTVDLGALPRSECS